jgi:circadian clock protein KaiC
MAHSNQFREFHLTGNGLMLEDVYPGVTGALTGSARAAQIVEDDAASLARREEIKRLGRQVERKRAVLESQMTLLRSEFEAEEEEMRKRMSDVEARERAAIKQRNRIAREGKTDEETGR